MILYSIAVSLREYVVVSLPSAPVVVSDTSSYVYFGRLLKVAVQAVVSPFSSAVPSNVTDLMAVFMSAALKTLNTTLAPLGAVVVLSAFNHALLAETSVSSALLVIVVVATSFSPSQTVSVPVTLSTVRVLSLFSLMTIVISFATS